ncbi:MAG: damage-inducible protein DinB [Burkholderiales bacterium]|nr:damage-inducible protein DinB [Burkholderiales bacterium]
MISTEYARTMARYNVWMNGKLYELCAHLSDSQRKEDLGAFFKSIHGTLNHLLLADRIWMGRFENTPPFAVTSLAQELHSDFSRLRNERVAMDARITQWAASLTMDALKAELRYTSMVNPGPRRMPMWLAVAHFFNHQTHHRGQLTALLSRRGIDPGVTDLMAVPSEGAEA